MPYRSASGARAMRDALRRTKRHAGSSDAISRAYSALDIALSNPHTREAALLVLAEFLTALFEGIILDPDKWDEADAISKTAE